MNTPTAMETLLSVVSSLLTEVWSVFDAIVAKPILLIPLAFFVIGGCVAIIKRILG